MSGPRGRKWRISGVAWPTWTRRASMPSKVHCLCVASAWVFPGPLTYLVDCAGRAVLEEELATMFSQVEEVSTAPPPPAATHRPLPLSFIPKPRSSCRVQARAQAERDMDAIHKLCETEHSLRTHISRLDPTYSADEFVEVPSETDPSLQLVLGSPRSSSAPLRCSGPFPL